MRQQCCPHCVVLGDASHGNRRRLDLVRSSSRLPDNARTKPSLSRWLVVKRKQVEWMAPPIGMLALECSEA